MADPCAPLAPQPKLPDLEPKYRDQVAGRFNEVLTAARKVAEPPVDVDEAKIVVFSDHHKGARDGADDFQRGERAYCAALGYYLEQGYQLYVLGDAEELWEETPQRVTRCYSEVLELEAEFLRPDRAGMVRFFGNHDDLWEDPAQVRRHFGGFFPGETVREALLLPLTDGNEALGELLFVHGHQGTTESDKFGRWARLPVRYLWRPLQRKLGYSATTPASDFGLRGTHDRAMFEWVNSQERDRPLILITGHTHRPVFSLPKPPARDVEEIAAELGGASGEGAADLRAELEHARAIKRDRAATALSVDPPCYFNSGCCSFPDGDITGLEIEGGEIRLVRWPDDDEKPCRRPLGNRFLRDIFTAVLDAEPGQAEIIEQVL